jgi:hypothetical protein
MKTMIAALGAVMLAAGLGLAASPAKAADCASLTSLSLPHVTITKTQEVAAASVRGVAMPAYCKVLGSAKPTADSDIRFEVVMPMGGAWNGRYLQVGNGGFAGNIPEYNMVQGLAAGYAVAGTDDGHQTQNGTDVSWALGHPEKMIDFGYRALKETTDAARAIVAAYEGRAPKFSYFAGCSDGGREALMEAQRYPDDFDGIVAGDPANHMTHLLVAAAWNIQALLNDPQSFIPTAKLKAVEDAALKACGDQDGVIENPLVCRFDPAVLRCAGADSDQCLTDAQVAAIRKIYGGARKPNGERIMSGFDPGGESEPQGWSAWITGANPAAPGQGLQYGFGHNFFSYAVFADPKYDFRQLNFDSDVTLTDAKYGGVIDSNSPDLSAFKKHGGKLIQYHGWADPAIPPRDSVSYFTRVQARMGDTAGFYRLFMAPGMLHCGGGRGPNVLPTLDAISAWVEKGTPPARLIATKFADNSPAKGVERTRPLCPYPRVAAWDGKGDRNKAESYSCAAAKKKAA